MRVIRVRVLILLSILYAALLFLIYQYVWHSRKDDTGNLFDAPGEDDVPHISNDVVQFNFKRRNGPPLHERNETFDSAVGGFNNSLGGEDLLNSSQVPSNQVPVLERPNPPSSHHSSRHRVENSSAEANEGESSLSHSKHPPHAQQGSTGIPLYDVSHLEPPNYCIHAFYYMWYGSPKFDGRYLHWNHRYLPHWQQSITNQYPKGRHTPPDDIGANFYPELGCYSSKDPKVIEAHMFQLRKAGVGVVSASWYPPGLADDEGIPPDSLIPLLLDIAHKYAIKVTLHLEPHDGRNPQNVRENLAYIRQTYFDHPAFYKHKVTTTDPRNGKTITRQLPVIYIYDSYKSEAREWAKLFKHDGEFSVRGTDIDCVAIALLVDDKHKQFVLSGGFDGFYTYFASDRFSYGSSPSNWAALGQFARDNNLIFIPSFGPGYDDTRVRPWNKENTKLRRGGKYYTNMFKSAIQNGVGTATSDGRVVKMVSLTSFNEWHEGTQIEPAIPKRTSGVSQYKYSDYSPHPPSYYLKLTHDTSASLQCSL